LKDGINPTGADDFTNLIQVVQNLAGYAVEGEASPEESIFLQSSALAACDTLDVGFRTEFTLGGVFV